jgi:hypothetical protein
MYIATINTRFIFCGISVKSKWPANLLSFDGLRISTNLGFHELCIDSEEDALVEIVFCQTSTWFKVVDNYFAGLWRLSVLFPVSYFQFYFLFMQDQSN